MYVSRSYDTGINEAPVRYHLNLGYEMTGENERGKMDDSSRVVNYFHLFSLTIVFIQSH